MLEIIHRIVMFLPCVVLSIYAYHVIRTDKKRRKVGMIRLAENSDFNELRKGIEKLERYNDEQKAILRKYVDLYEEVLDCEKQINSFQDNITVVQKACDIILEDNKNKFIDYLPFMEQLEQITPEDLRKVFGSVIINTREIPLDKQTELYDKFFDDNIDVTFTVLGRKVHISRVDD